MLVGWEFRVVERSFWGNNLKIGFESEHKKDILFWYLALKKRKYDWLERELKKSF